LGFDWQNAAVKERLRELAQAGYFYDRVEAVRHLDPEPTFDFALAETHSFIANGVITHNTTLALHAIAEAQKQGGVCAFVDAEHALDTAYARRVGVRLEDVLITQPDCGEQALEIAEQLVRSGAIDLLVIDSVAALTPRAEIEGEMGDAHMGLQARLMSQAMRKLTAVTSRTDTVILFINQTRMKIGVVFGNPEVTTGGNALKFYASVRCEIRRIGALKDGDRMVGNRTRVKVVKNKCAPPFREVEFDVVYGVGIHKSAELLEAAEVLGIVTRSGSWFEHAGEKLGNGKSAVCAALTERPEILAELERAVRAHYGLSCPGRPKA
jgi:recombination protein RecA